LAEAVGLLREVSKQAKDGRLVAISASDPLNLVGIVLPGQRIPALAGNRIVYRDGALLARWIGGKLLPAEMLSSELESAVRNLLFRHKPMGKRSSTDGLRRRSSTLSHLHRY
jgi:ATP-dependent Lhr-like helicase